MAPVAGGFREARAETGPRGVRLAELRVRKRPEDKVIMPMGDGQVGWGQEQLHAHTSETAENKSKTRPDKPARVPSALHFRGGRRHRPR